MKKPISIISLLLICFTAIGQKGAIYSPGNITQVKEEKQGLQLQTQNAFIQITAYSPTIIRVRMDKKPLERDFSYAVISKPDPVVCKIKQSNAEINFETDSIKMVITKSPFSVAFYNSSGALVSKDEKGLTTSWIGDVVTTYKTMQEGERFIGLGEKTGSLNRAGSGYTNWNTDAYGYSDNQDPIYATIPFYIGVHHQVNYGIFFDNTYQSDFNFGASNNRFSSFGANGGEMNYYFIYRSRVADIIADYTQLTGRMTLPPLWSLGYQQNRYSYYPDTEVLRIAQTLREKQIPADGITLDIHYMDQYKLFTWDKMRFPDPVKMNKELEKMGFKTTVIVDPGIKVEKGYAAYEDGLKNDIFIKYPDGNNWTAQVWPGWCHFPDFTYAKGRDWWKKHVNFFTDMGVSGLWNDMNEIASWGNKMPYNILFNNEGKPTTTLEAHNIYGLEMARASFEGAKAASPKRPFILTRAAYSGLQRYTAIWTGDNRSEDSHMMAGVRLLNSLGLSGVAFSGMDIGGFTGNPSVPLYARWIQIGALNPYFRGHTGVNTKSSEPWTFGEEVTEIARNFIGLRYQLLPYIYSHFYEATQTGMPVMRSLAIDHTFENQVYDSRFQNQYLFGSALMVLPFESSQQFGEAYFPKGRWYDLFSGAVQENESEKILKLNYNRLPVYVKESSIIPMQTLVQSTAEKPSDTLLLHIYRGNVENKFIYYEDDGETYQYEQGKYFKRVINYVPSKSVIQIGKKEGSFTSHFKNIKIVLHGFNEDMNFRVNGESVAYHKDFISLLAPISKFNPQGAAGSLDGESVLSFVIKNSDGAIEIKY